MCFRKQVIHPLNTYARVCLNTADHRRLLQITADDHRRSLQITR